MHTKRCAKNAYHLTQNRRKLGKLSLPKRCRLPEWRRSKYYCSCQRPNSFLKDQERAKCCIFRTTLPAALSGRGWPCRRPGRSSFAGTSWSEVRNEAGDRGCRFLSLCSPVEKWTVKKSNSTLKLFKLYCFTPPNGCVWWANPIHRALSYITSNELWPPIAHNENFSETWVWHSNLL